MTSCAERSRALAGRPSWVRRRQHDDGLFRPNRKTYRGTIGIGPLLQIVWSWVTFELEQIADSATAWPPNVLAARRTSRMGGVSMLGHCVRQLRCAHGARWVSLRPRSPDPWPRRDTSVAPWDTSGCRPRSLGHPAHLYGPSMSVGASAQLTTLPGPRGLPCRPICFQLKVTQLQTILSSGPISIPLYMFRLGRKPVVVLARRTSSRTSSASARDLSARWTSIAQVLNVGPTACFARRHGLARQRRVVMPP